MADQNAGTSLPRIIRSTLFRNTPYLGLAMLDWMSRVVVVENVEEPPFHMGFAFLAAERDGELFGRLQIRGAKSRKAPGSISAANEVALFVEYGMKSFRSLIALDRT
jgi:hypothetical protein